MGFQFSIEPRDEDRFTENWKVFYHEHVAWVDSQTDESGVLYSLPAEKNAEALRLFKIDNKTIEAELAFADLCNRYDAIAFSRGRPISYRLLGNGLPLPEINDTDRLRKLGWGQEHIDWLAKGGDPTKDIARRMQAAAGRLLVMPSFLAARDEILAVWQAIPIEQRPPLPLSLPFSPPESFPFPKKLLGPRVDAALEKFWHIFIDFCDTWQLTGMATWELPEPVGPKRTMQSTAKELAKLGVVTTSHPWHYPLHVNEKVGELAIDHHGQLSRDHGIDDHGSWETYAKFLPITHWEHVLRSRYDKSRRIRRFVTSMVPLLSQLAEVGNERVQTLRKCLASLRAGKTQSLKDRR